MKKAHDKSSDVDGTLCPISIDQSPCKGYHGTFIKKVNLEPLLVEIRRLSYASLVLTPAKGEDLYLYAPFTSLSLVASVERSQTRLLRHDRVNTQRTQTFFRITFDQKCLSLCRNLCMKCLKPRKHSANSGIRIP